jgi:hypothetical protein
MHSVMVTATVVPSMVRVGFPVKKSETERVEVVCFVRPESTGELGIYYDGHYWYSRDTPTQDWQHKARFRQDVTTLLASQIRTNVMLELWSAFGSKVQSVPEDVNTVEELDRALR